MVKGPPPPRLTQPPADSYSDNIAIAPEESCEQPPTATQTGWEASPVLNVGLAVITAILIPFGIFELINEEGFARFRTIVGAMCGICALWGNSFWRHLADRWRARA